MVQCTPARDVARRCSFHTRCPRITRLTGYRLEAPRTVIRPCLNRPVPLHQSSGDDDPQTGTGTVVSTGRRCSVGTIKFPPGNRHCRPDAATSGSCQRVIALSAGVPVQITPDPTRSSPPAAPPTSRGSGPAAPAARSACRVGRRARHPRRRSDPRQRWSTADGRSR